MRARFGISAVAFSAASFLIGASLSHAQSARELYDQAKLKKTLVLCGGGPAALYEGAAREFEQRRIPDQRRVRDQRREVDQGIRDQRALGRAADAAPGPTSVVVVIRYW